MKRWCVAVSNPNSEHQAFINLRADGHEPYLPLYWDGVARRPLFANYVLVAFSKRWRETFRVRGVRRLLLSSSGEPGKIEHAFVRWLRSLENSRGLIVLPRPDVGAKVEIKRGRYRGATGLYAGTSANARERVLLTMLGHGTEITVPFADMAVV